MPRILDGQSKSLKEFRILPGFTNGDCAMKNVSLRSRLCCNNQDYLYLQSPFLSAAMQAVTGVEMAIALAQLGGVGVLPVSQSTVQKS
jgi:IMP dehydrogenase